MPNQFKDLSDSDVIKLEGTLDWKYGQDPASKKWVAQCKVFGLTIEADSFSGMHETMLESIETILKEMYSTGDLKKFLQSHGLLPAAPLPPKPKISHRHSVSFDIPVRTKRMNQRDLQGCFC